MFNFGSTYFIFCNLWAAADLLLRGDFGCGDGDRLLDSMFEIFCWFFVLFFSQYFLFKNHQFTTKFQSDFRVRSVLWIFEQNSFKLILWILIYFHELPLFNDHNERLNDFLFRKITNFNVQLSLQDRIQSLSKEWFRTFQMFYSTLAMNPESERKVPFLPIPDLALISFITQKLWRGWKNWKLEEWLEISLTTFSRDLKGNCSLVVKSDSTSIVSLKQRTKWCPGNRK